MQVCWRPLPPGAVDHELVWLSVSLAGLLAAASWLAAGLPWPHCVFLSVTGHPCLTCGATRATVQFFRGHFLTALGWNPLVFAGLCGLTIFDIYAGIVLVLRCPRLRIAGMSPQEKAVTRVLVLLLLALNWSYLLAHSRDF